MTDHSPLSLMSPAGCAHVCPEPNATIDIGPRLSPAGVVVIDGVDLSKPISAVNKDCVRAAFRDYHVVIFRNQTLSREQQFAFATNFGDVEPSIARQSGNKRHGVAHVISNLDGEGKPAHRSASAVSNYNWHTDKPYRRMPPMMTALYAVDTPPQGGDTEFANTAMAYYALEPEVKRRIAGLRVVFYWGAAHCRSEQPPLAGSDIRDAVDHPLVRTHPETGAKALYIGNHSSHVLGWPIGEGRALLDELLAHATQPRFVYAHRWRVGDLVMWDNRCLLHRAVANFEMTKHRRILHRTVVRGTVPF